MNQALTESWINVVVARRALVPGRVLVLDLVPARGAALPAFTAGAHVAVRCGDSVRHYSLCGSLDDLASYRIAVKLEQSGAGSTWLHDHARVGTELRISTPRNYFPLVGGRPHYLFISGGIGVSPILPMLHALRAEGRRARLVHLCRAPDELAFGDELAHLGTFHDVHLHVDRVAGGLFDLTRELAQAEAETEVYCCGPEPVMAIVRQFAERSGRSPHYHFEVFHAGTDQPQSGNEAFVVELARTGRRIVVGRDQTILAALREAGIAPESECEEGVCGTCATRVVAGVPDHRDAYLTDEERAAASLIMICVSRSRTPVLALDLEP